MKPQVIAHASRQVAALGMSLFIITQAPAMGLPIAEDASDRTTAQAQGSSPPAVADAPGMSPPGTVPALGTNPPSAAEAPAVDPTVSPAIII
jgi:hypothetical protein